MGLPPGGRALAGLLTAIHEVSSTGAWKGDGAGDLSAWMAARFQMSCRTAREVVSMAMTTSERPPLQEAMATGDVSVDQVKAVTALTEPGANEAGAWVDALRFWSYDELEREARKATARKLERTDGGRYLRLDITRDERFMRIRGQLHPEEGALVQKALDRRIPANASLRDFDRAYADAIVDLAGTAVASDDDPDRATVVVHVDKESLRRIEHSNGTSADGARPHEPAPAAPAPAEPVELDTGAFVPPKVAERLSCDCRVEFLTTSASGNAVAVARARRMVPPWMFRALRRRDRTCVFPGCDRARRVQGHHIAHWSVGGPTELENLVLLCWTHHLLVHEGGWSLRGKAGPSIHFVRPDGSVLKRRSSPPTRAPTPPPAGDPTPVSAPAQVPAQIDTS
ncbi:MAG TPA: HNH endonuclease [Actinomycetota bacterium]|nr:HNH endonuclease [Actinomycetota bacterium]